MLSNDTDIDDGLDPASVVITSTPSGATLAADGKTLTVPGQGVWTVNTTTGAITFTPEADYNGTPTAISYTVKDASGAVSNTATVSVTVTPVNDAPVIDLNSKGSNADTTRDNAVTYTENTPAINVANATLAVVYDSNENDITSMKIVVGGVKDGANEVISIGGQTFAANASSSAIVTIGTTDFQITYTAGAGGTGTFNISQVGGGAIINADLDALVRSVTYVDNGENPTAGDRTLTFTAKDTANLTSAPAVATITVVPVNDPPVATNDTNSIGEDGVSVSGDVILGAAGGIGQDTDVDGGPLFISGAVQGTTPLTIGTEVTLVGGGKLTLKADGTYTFKPGTAYNGLDAGETATETITYTLNDGLLNGTATATLVITINGTNDAPVVIDPANPGTASNPIQATDPLNIIPDVTRNDGQALMPIIVSNYIVDPDGEPLTYTLGTNTPSWISIDPATGEITGTPPRDASQLSNTGNPGEYLLTITVKDVDGASVTTTVTLTIVNLPRLLRMMRQVLARTRRLLEATSSPTRQRAMLIRHQIAIRLL